MPSRNKKKKGKKGGKKAARAAATATSSSPPGDAAAAQTSRESEPANIITDATSLPAPDGKVAWRERKDRKLVARSMERTPPSNLLLGRLGAPLVKLSRLRLNVIGPDGESVVKGNASILRCKKAKSAYAIVKQNELLWNDSCRGACSFYGENNWTECERLASCVLDDMDRSLSRLFTSDDEVEKLVLIHDYHIEAYFTRGDARLQLGNYQGAIDDANEALVLLEAWEGDGDAGHRLSDQIDKLIYNRGASLSRLGDARGAKADFRAACALFRLRGDRDDLPKDKAAFHLHCIGRVLEAYALQKVKCNAPRPHYTTKQDDKIQKELGIGIFSKTNYRCLGCGAVPSDSVELFCCGGCEAAWLCGEECQAKAWEEGHEQACKPFHSQLDANEKRNLEENIKKNGFALAAGKYHDNVHVVCLDEETGRFFDSLSNQDLIET